MQVKEILRVKGNRLLTIEPSGRAVEAVRIMAEENLGSLVVLDEGRMLGVLTFREILRALAARMAGQDPDALMRDVYHSERHLLCRECRDRYLANPLNLPLPDRGLP